MSDKALSITSQIGCTSHCRFIEGVRLVMALCIGSQLVVSGQITL